MTERRYLYVYRSCSAFQLTLSSYVNQVHRVATPGSCRGVCKYCSLIFEKFFCKSYVNVTHFHRGAGRGLGLRSYRPGVLWERAPS